MGQTTGRTDKPVLLHLTTTDISLELLLGPQLEAFVAAGYDVHAASATGPFVPAIEARNVTFHTLEHSTRSVSPIEDLRAAVEFAGLCRRLRPDIVHTHNPKPGIYGRIAARMTRVPSVANTVHGLYAQPTDRLAKRAVVYSLERLAASFSDAELVQSSEDIDTLRQLRVSRNKLVKLGNGIDLDRFTPATQSQRREIRASLGFDDDVVVVGAVGRLVDEKGYLELFAAFDAASAELPQLRLVVIGPHEPGKGDALPENVLGRARARGVLFLGYREDVQDLYPAMDMFVLPSHREGFPRSAMEAAATGLPLVVTDIRGCREVVDDGLNGLLVPAQDAVALEQAISKLGRSAPMRLRMGDAGVLKAREHFDQQRVIETTLATYRRLLDR